MKKIISLILVLSMVFAFCASSVAESSPFEVAVILKNCATVYDSWLAAATEAAAAKYDNIHVTVYDSAGDDAAQVNFIENVVLQGANLIIIQRTSMWNSDELFQSVVNEDHIPIITVNVPVQDGVSNNIPAPNFALGYNEGVYAAETLPENAKILIVRGKLADVEQERYDGLRAGLASREDITILAEEHAFYDQAQAMALMEDWLQIYEDFDGVLSLCDSMALGVVEACKGYDANFDFSKVKIYSIDGLPDSCMAIEAGYLVCTIQQSADVMMEAAIKLANDILTGVQKERVDIEIETVTITKDNVAQYLDAFKAAGYID